MMLMGCDGRCRFWGLQPVFLKDANWQPIIAYCDAILLTCTSGSRQQQKSLFWYWAVDVLGPAETVQHTVHSHLQT